MKTMIKIQLLVIIILSLNSNLLAYEQIPYDCDNVNYYEASNKLSYRFTAQGFDYHTKTVEQIKAKNNERSF
ncbi:MAG: hypothetical protein M0P99_03150 [Candidatus Cloacimonetes bacterium]|nr:hypothetical protein [Candidatus Cloacimonadota bacterium]